MKTVKRDSPVFKNDREHTHQLLCFPLKSRLIWLFVHSLYFHIHLLTYSLMQNCNIMTCPASLSPCHTTLYFVTPNDSGQWHLQKESENTFLLSSILPWHLSFENRTSLYSCLYRVEHKCCIRIMQIKKERKTNTIATPLVQLEALVVWCNRVDMLVMGHYCFKFGYKDLDGLQSIGLESITLVWGLVYKLGFCDSVEDMPHYFLL